MSHYHARIVGRPTLGYMARTQDEALALAVRLSGGRTVTVKPCECASGEGDLPPCDDTCECEGCRAAVAPARAAYADAIRAEVPCPVLPSREGGAS